MCKAFRLIYKDIGGENREHVLEAVPVSSSPDEQPCYFYGLRRDDVRGPKRVCFIKRHVVNDQFDQYRAGIERTGVRISSPYVAAIYNDVLMQDIRLEYDDSGNGNWKPLNGTILVSEYLPENLEEFWTVQTQMVSDEVLERYRQEILLKLIQGVAHMEQARMVHCDIKPQNILINSIKLCEEASWYFDQLDVKLADLDCAHDGNQATPRIFAGTPPYQPPVEVRPNIWLDLYSICMVALWLYNGDLGLLHRIGCELSQIASKDALEEMMPGPAAQPYQEVLVPFLFQAIQQINSGIDDGGGAGREALSKLYRKISDMSPKDPTLRPMEIMSPPRIRKAWSAIVQIDGISQPVFCEAREYRLISIVNCLKPRGSAPEDVVRYPSGVSNSLIYTGNSSRKSMSDLTSCIDLSAPADICIFCDSSQMNGRLSLAAGVYGNVKNGNVYTPQRLAYHGGITKECNLYAGQPLRIHGWDMELFKSIQVHSVRFYNENDCRPERLPVFRGESKNKHADINIVFLITPRCEASNKNDSPGCKLMKQVVQWLSSKKDYRPCYYGAMIRTEDGKFSLQSFCGGLMEMNERSISGLYATAKNLPDNAEPGWSIDSPQGSAAPARYAFDPGLPTVVTGVWEHPDIDETHFLKFKEHVYQLSPEFRYAVHYLQLFTVDGLDQSEEIRRAEPWLDAATRPEGACLVTPLKAGGEIADPEARWKAAISYWCTHR